MSIVYRVYVGINGPPDYTTPAIVTASLTADLPVIGPGSVVTAVVRPFDTVTGLEDTSSDARIVVTLDAAGEDNGAYPVAPTGLTVKALPGGTARVSWAYPSNGGARGFRVYTGTTLPDYSMPVVSVGWTQGRTNAATLTGLTGGTYTVAVRAFNAAGEESNTNILTIIIATTGPSAVVAVSGSAVP